MKDTHQNDTEFNEGEIPTQDYPLTPLDKDILDLFTPSETGSINGIGEGVVPPSGPPTSLPPTDHEVQFYDSKNSLINLQLLH